MPRPSCAGVCADPTEDTETKSAAAARHDGGVWVGAGPHGLPSRAEADVVARWLRARCGVALREPAALCSAHMSRLAPRPKNLIRRQRSRKMARQACAASGGMLAASVADTRVDLVSSSSIDVSVVILAVSIVQDRWIIALYTP